MATEGRARLPAPLQTSRNEARAAQLRADPGRDSRAAVSVLLIARQPIVRAGLEALLLDARGVEVAGGAASVGEAIEVVEEASVDVALAALESRGLDEIRSLADRLGSAGVPLVLVGSLSEELDVASLLAVGARGLLLAESTGEELGAALHSAVAGLFVLDAAFAGAFTVSGDRVGAAVANTMVERLTEREQEVLELLALGLPNKTIAKRLAISQHTVKFHVGSILGKLGASSRTEAVTRAARAGVLAL